MTAPQDPFDPSAPRPPEGPPYGYGQPPPGNAPYGSPPQGYGQPGFGQQGWGQPGPGGPPPSGTNGMAIGALVAAFFCSPLGIALGFVAKNQISKTGQSGSGLATAAIVISVVSLLLGVLLVVGGLSATTAP